MGTELRVLLLEESPEDAALEVLELRRAGFDTEWRRVETEAEFIAALDSPVDLILAGYNLADFDALSALARVAESGLEVPFIVVSGAIGEDAAVRAMQAGAADYVIKDRLARLGQAARRALEQRRDRIERQQAQEQLRQLALYDMVTDLPNRVLFSDRLRHAISMAQRRQDSFGLLLMDLDRFKDVNDSLGHHLGDQLLKLVADRISAALRESDTVARLGGDEFAVITGATDGVDDAMVAARKVLNALSDPFTLGETPVRIGASIGIALYPDHGHESETLMRRADVAMYVAKSERSGCAVYAPSQDANILERMGLVRDLYQAIPQGELVMHYQPKVLVGSRRAHSAEALVRWRHPDKGLLHPEDFVPFAEKTDLIGPLTRWIMEAALSQVASWRAGGLELGVAVNLSASNLYDPDLATTIGDALRRWQVPPDHLMVEITETTIMAAHTAGTVHRLSGLGIGISIDDFGTGYSSLRHLKTLPVDEIKIDQSFVGDMVKDAGDAAIVKCTIDLARNLGIRVTAEGVESKATWTMLESLGCDSVQGHWLARAMPAGEFEGWIRDSGWGGGSNAARAPAEPGPL